MTHCLGGMMPHHLWRGNFHTLPALCLKEELTPPPIIMDKNLQINSIKRAIGQLTIQMGVVQIWGAISDFAVSAEGNFNDFGKFLFGLPVVQLDDTYYFTSWDNWQKIIATINPILKQFKWKKERFDCDKRAMLATSLIALLFEVNTVRPVYCSVQRVVSNQLLYMHYANIIVDDAGNTWLWDLDNGGQFTKITSTTPIIGDLKYNLIAVK